MNRVTQVFTVSDTTLVHQAVSVFKHVTKMILTYWAKTQVP
jgi:hypothetical protein